VTVLGIIFAVMYVVSLRWGRRGIASVMVLATPFFDSAALNVGNISLSPFYLGSALFACITVPLMLRGGALSHFRPLEYLLLYAAIVTAISPALFAGTPVIASGLGIDEQVGYLAELTYSISNVAQIAYLGLNTIFVLGSMREGMIKRGFVTGSFWIGTILGASAVLANFVGVSWPSAFFHNSERGLYSVETYRVYAQFSEPSHLGAYSVIALSYFVVLLLQERRNGASAVLAFGALIAGINVIGSDAGTAFAALAILFPVAVVAGAITVARAGPGRQLAFAPALFLAAAILYAILRGPEIVTLVVDRLGLKAASGSLASRTYADSVGVNALWSTYGLGAGLGSNRTSSLAYLLLGTIGLAGTLLFAITVTVCIYRGWKHPQTRAAASGIAAFIAAAVISYADFANPVMWTLIAFVLGQAVRHAPAKPPGQEDLSETSVRTKDARRSVPGGLASSAPA
jgi:hypothetical protein